MKNTLQIIYSSLLLIIAGSFGKLYQVADNYFVANLGKSETYVYNILSYPSFLLMYVSITVGFSLLVVLGKSTSKGQRKLFFSGGLMLTLLISLLFIITCFLFKNKIIEVFTLNIPLLSKYYFIILLSSLLIPINSIFKYYAISKNQIRKVLIADGIGNLLNMTGNYLSISFLSPDYKIIGIALTTIIFNLAILTYYISLYSQDFSIKFKTAFIFAKRSKELLFGEVLTITVAAILPIVYSYMLKEYGTSATSSAYSVSLYISELVSIPIYALNAIGTSYLAKSGISLKRFSEIIYSTIILCTTPAIILLITANEFLSVFFNITAEIEINMFKYFIWAIILKSTITPIVCHIRVIEKNIIYANLNIFSNLIAAIIFTYFVVENIQLAISFLLILPNILIIFLLGLYYIKRDRFQGGVYEKS